MKPFEEIVAEHGAVVLRVCRALLPTTDADDAWSETFIAALRAYPTLRDHGNVRGWLVTIAHRKSIDQIRSRNRAPMPTEHLPEVPIEHTTSGSDGLPSGDDVIRRAISNLPPKQRAAVVYRHLAGMPYAEVATLLGGTEAAARRSAADGIARLRRLDLRGTP